MKRLRRNWRDAKILLVELLFVVPVVAGLTLGCAHTVDYESLTTHDTDTVLHHDTLPGPAFVRFLSVTDQSQSILLKLSQDVSSPFGVAQPQTDHQYYPLSGDQPVVLYTSWFSPWNQETGQITIPVNNLKPNSLTTVVLFQTDAQSDTLLFPYFASDSTKRKPIPPGYCYMRLVEGMPDYPSVTPSVNLHLDAQTNPPLFTDKSGNDAPIAYLSASDYILIPIGQHTVYAFNSNAPSQFFSTQVTFETGKYYTARLVGFQSNATGQFVIESE